MFGNVHAVGRHLLLQHACVSHRCHRIALARTFVCLNGIASCQTKWVLHCSTLACGILRMLYLCVGYEVLCKKRIVLHSTFLLVGALVRPVSR